MNTCKIVEGRLMEINVASGYQKPEDVDAMIGLMAAGMAKAGRPVIVFADWRQCGIFSDAVGERVTVMLRDHPMIERGAILHTEAQKVFLLQVRRLVRDGGHKSRRAFTDPREVMDFLGEKLTLAERDRLDLLLQGPTTG